MERLWEWLDAINAWLGENRWAWILPLTVTTGYLLGRRSAWLRQRRLRAYERTRDATLNKVGGGQYAVAPPLRPSAHAQRPATPAARSRVGGGVERPVKRHPGSRDA